MKQKTILVTGGGGYIGTGVVEKLLEKNYKVKVFDKFFYGKDIFTDMKNSKNIEYVEADIREISSLKTALKNVDSVIHLAGIVGDIACSVDEKLAREVNIEATYKIKEAVKLFPIEKFIFASTCAVYGSTQQIVHEESQVDINAISIYAQTKLIAERDLLEDTSDKLHPIILRFTTVFGHSWKMRFDLAINLFVGQTFHNIPITLIGGDQWRPFIHVQDLAIAILTVLEAPLKKVNRQIFNVGDDRQHMQIKEVISMIENMVKDERKIKVKHKKGLSNRGDYRVSFKKITEQLQFQRSKDIEVGIREIYENFRNGIYTKDISDPYYSSLQTERIKKT